jgi:hypothetical protein
MNIDYISGFFDADGSITMCKNKKDAKFKTIKIDFTNTELNILISIQNFLKNNYNIKLHISSKRTVKINHNQSFCLSTTSNQECIKLCKLLKSIHPKKLHRINTILKYHNLVTKRNGKYNNKQISRKLAYERLFFSSLFQVRSDYIIIPTNREQDAKSGY